MGELERRPHTEMNAPDPWLRCQRAAAQAASLDERLAAAGDRQLRGLDPSPRPLNQWRKACAAGDAEAFSRRLSWDGLAEESAAVALAATPGERPSWLDLLQQVRSYFPAVLEELRERGSVSEEALFEEGRPLPFLELCTPFLRFAAAELSSQPRLEVANLSAEAWQALQRRWAHDWVRAALPVLYPRFDAHRRSSPLPVEAEGRRIYGPFVEGLLEGGILDLLADYPVLGRRLCEQTASWIAADGAWIEHLAADRPALADVFHGGRDPGAVVDLRLGLSDRHQGGRSVVELRFESGLALIYKPRDLSAEACFHALLGALEESGCPDVPPRLEVLEGEVHEGAGHGWMEKVVQEPLSSRAEASAYYRKSGTLLALAYALRADDLHAENLIAGSAGPYLVDAETLLQPRREENDPWRRSCLRSQLLGNVQRDAAGGLYDYGGLQGRGGFVAETGRPFWKYPNRDAMGFETRDAAAPAAANAVLLAGEVQRLEDYREEVLEGFETAYRHLLRQRRAWLAEGGPLEAFRRVSPRILLRPSRVYGVLLSRLEQPRYQRHGWMRGVLIDSLNRAFVGAAERPALWPLVAEERRALERGDLPLFTLSARASALRTSEGEVLAGSLKASPWESLVDQVEALSGEDLERQLGLLGQALAESPTRAMASRRQGPAAATAADPALISRLVDAARRLGDDLDERQRHAGEAGRPWHWLLPDDRRGAPALGLYDGAAGVALFFTALHRQTGEARWRELAAAALEPLQRSLAARSGDRTSGARSGGTPALPRAEGALSGLGGLIYALVHLASALQEEPWLAAAEEVARDLLDPSRDLAEPLDLADGRAGALLGLLTLHDQRPSADLRATCRRLGEDLGRALAGERGAGLGAGMGHGLAGVAHAMLRLHEVDARPEWLQAVRRAHALERRRFSPQVRNWPAAGPRGAAAKPVMMVAWCNGAPGVGLARAAGWPLLADGEILQEIETALATTLAEPPAGVDHLCCGNLGRLELFLQAGLSLERPSLIEQARQAAALGLRRVEAEGGFRLDSGPGGRPLYDPGFFRGLAGIGYALLRLANPAAHPSILSFQPVA